MRTTLNLDDDVLDIAHALARTEHRSLGSVISDLARRGLAPREASAYSETNGFPIFAVGPDARVITDEMVAAAMDEA